VDENKNHKAEAHIGGAHTEKEIIEAFGKSKLISCEKPLSKRFMNSIKGGVDNLYKSIMSYPTGNAPDGIILQPWQIKMFALWHTILFPPVGLT
jgi:hypothetical protein